MRAAATLAALLALELCACSGAPGAGSAGGDSAAAGAAGPGGDGARPLAARSAEPLQVAVSVPPQAWLVERVGGPRVQVTTMLAAGASEHAVELHPRQLLALERARVYVLVGHPDFLLESQRIVPLLRDRPQVQVVDMAQGVQLLEASGGGQREAPGGVAAHGAGPRGARGQDAEHDHSEADPHLWLAPSAMRVAAVNVARGLQQADPAHGAEFAQRLVSLQGELDQLDARIRSLLGSEASPPSRRFLVYHPAWGYFAHEFGLQQVAIEQEGKEPSPLRLIQIIERVRALGLRTVFVQRGISTRSARVIARELGADVVELDPMARDWKAAVLQAAGAIGASLTRAGVTRDTGSAGTGRAPAYSPGVLGGAP